MHRGPGDLPADLVAEIARRLPCLADRVRASAACRTWRQGLLILMNPRAELKNPRAELKNPEAKLMPPEPRPRPPQLPWLLLPYQRAAALPPNATRRASFFCVLCNHTHRFGVPHYTGGARFFGAYPGGWLFLAYGQSCGHGLINLSNHQSLVLPDDIVSRDDGSVHPMLIRAATLSAPPGSLEGCVAAAIITILAPKYFCQSHIAFWRMGSRQVRLACLLDAGDVIYRNGAFHFVTNEGNLLLCTPEFQNEAPVEQLRVRSETRIMWGGVRNAGALYLVECRGELLMVLRVQPHREVTRSFRVFRMTQEQQVLYADHAHYRWTELDALDGRMLFVGRGCSRSFEAADYPGSQEGVYFLDDGSFHAAPMICFGDGPRQYGCSNNGVWFGLPYRVHHWVRGQRPSNYSSPVWFFVD